MELNQPCIAIDVSKGYSHVCGFLKTREPIDKVFKIYHNSQGFMQLKTLFSKLSEMGHLSPVFIFESTGIYHRPLRSFLETMNYPFIEVSPLLAAKHRKNSAIRSAKTDTRDTHALTRLFYDIDFVPKKPTDETYHEMRQYHRYYGHLEALMVKCKVHFNEKLDILFPRFRDEVDHKIYTRYYLELLKICPHPQLITEKRVDWIENLLIKNGIQGSRARSVAENIKAYCKSCWSGSVSNSADTYVLKQLIEQIQDYVEERQSILESMAGLAQKFPLYSQLLSIPGIGPVLGVRLMAELGDLSQFASRDQLIAYAGLDPIVYQSGAMDGKGLAISKKGNKHLRKVLYLVIEVSVHTRFDHRIKEFYQRKKQKSSPKSAYIASCDKLLKIIFKMHQTGENYIL